MIRRAFLGLLGLAPLLGAIKPPTAKKKPEATFVTFRWANGEKVWSEISGHESAANWAVLIERSNGR